MLQHWIWLATRSGMGDSGRKALAEHFSDPEQIYFADAQAFSSLDFLSQQALSSLADKDLKPAQRILDECHRLKIHLLTIHDGAYPAKLRNIPDPPVVLYYKGQLPDLDATATVGVVGTREASAYGLVTAQKLGYQIARCGAIVVSGMARGIDALAMKGALSAGMSVVGVLGCGADVIYPPRNRALFADTENYGCILTEYPPGTPPLGQNFPRRNRIISGLSDGVLVIEAPEQSGALITARRAADQGRDVFVVPSNIDVDSGKGSNALLRDGAIAVGSGWDVVSEYVRRYPDKLCQKGDSGPDVTAPELTEEPEQTDAQTAQSPLHPAQKPQTQKKSIDNPENGNYIDLTKIEASLSETELCIVKQLRSGQKLVDDLIADSGLRSASVLSSLTLLEVKGIVRRLPGRYVALKGE